MDLIRVIYLAELPDGVRRANQLLQEVAARDLGAWDLFNSQLILRFLGRKQEAIEVSRKFLARPDRFPAVRKESFRRHSNTALDRGRRRICSTHADLSLGFEQRPLFDRPLGACRWRPRKARRHLQRCLDTRYFEALPYSLSLSFLARMSQDPAWPPWIKPRP